MAVSETRRLAVPTHRTKAGPKLTHSREQLVVDYDFEEDDGSLQCARLSFEEVLSFEYRDSSCCCAEDVLAPSEIRVQSDSLYLRLVTERWSESVGNHGWQLSMGGRGRFLHYTIYFDDACSLNVVASACEASSNSRSRD